MQFKHPIYLNSLKNCTLLNGLNGLDIVVDIYFFAFDTAMSMFPYPSTSWSFTNTIQWQMLSSCHPICTLRMQWYQIEHTRIKSSDTLFGNVKTWIQFFIVQCQCVYVWIVCAQFTHSCWVWWLNIQLLLIQTLLYVCNEKKSFQQSQVHSEPYHSVCAVQISTVYTTYPLIDNSA